MAHLGFCRMEAFSAAHTMDGKPRPSAGLVMAGRSEKCNGGSPQRALRCCLFSFSVLEKSRFSPVRNRFQKKRCPPEWPLWQSRN